ncbi:LysR family transcriptional regulator [Hominifimenecus sp. rT4P-3]|uniref:LysR family transcriptional regulator n=1 Tax=Hominifimenecus sp. rT4P-3 TaxID=3242979 RepID=UPI003DA6A8CE
MYIPDFAYYIEVAQCLNISKASEKCHVTQQSMSDYIKRLESYYQVTLFTRHPKLELTAEGRTLLEYALKIQNTLKSLQTSLKLTSQINQSIVIGFAGPLGRFALKYIPLEELTKNFPHICFQLYEGEPLTLFRQFHENKIDFLLTPTEILSPDTDFLPLIEKNHYLLISSRSLRTFLGDYTPDQLEKLKAGVDLLDFSSFPVVLFKNSGTTYNAIASYFYANNIILSASGTINSISGILQTISEQNAWGYCSEDVLSNVNDNILLFNGQPIFAFPIKKPDLTYCMYLSYKKEKKELPDFTLIRDCIAEYILKTSRGE